MSEKQKIIILAAGKGSRMNSEEPKVLAKVLARPMIDWVMTEVEKVKDLEKPVVVVGYQGERVRKFLNDRVEYVRQERQLGTGHAVASAKPKLENFQGAILVLYGDHPLVSQKNIKRIFEKHFQEKSCLTMMTTKISDFLDWRKGFSGFGRIIRDQNNNIQAVREFKDCSETEKKIKELNPGYCCFDSEWLWQNISKLQNQNNQQEYYLTDLIEMAVKQGHKIQSIQIPPIECLGVNTKEQLELVERLLNS